MKILVDKNNLLVIENANIPKLKEYTNIASGYRFSDFDKGIIVYHKKEIKIINLKNLGDNMNIFYVTKRGSLIENNLDQNGFLSALRLFSGFDENSGNIYFFIPRMKESEMKVLNENLDKLGMDIRLKKSDKGIIIDPVLHGTGQNGSNKIPVASFANETGMTSVMSFLFGLVLVYGKIDVKNGNLISIKAHIPLFGQYVKYKEELDELLKNLQENGIFLSHSIMQNDDGIVYQISSSDYELLGSFANYYQSVEKIQKILKQDFNKKTKSELIDFINTNEQIPNDGKEEVLGMIEDAVMKILTVGIGN